MLTFDREIEECVAQEVPDLDQAGNELIGFFTRLQIDIDTWCEERNGRSTLRWLYWKKPAVDMTVITQAEADILEQLIIGRKAFQFSGVADQRARQLLWTVLAHCITDAFAEYIAAPGAHDASANTRRHLILSSTQMAFMNICLAGRHVHDRISV